MDDDYVSDPEEMKKHTAAHGEEGEVVDDVADDVGENKENEPIAVGVFYMHDDRFRGGGVRVRVETVATEAGHQVIDQASELTRFRVTRHAVTAVSYNVSDDDLHNFQSQLINSGANEDDHFLKEGLPGQPAGFAFKQYAGHITVNESAQRALFYYFVESACESSTKPLILWLNGGPGCSSFGMGALTEIGPFGVNPDGKTLYAREFAWNKVANILFLESPAGVGFSYSNSSYDYVVFSDKKTAGDTYVFLMKWFEKYPIGNGLLDDVSDTRGMGDFLWTHDLASDATHEMFLRGCAKGGLYENAQCTKAYVTLLTEIGDINYMSINSPAPECIPMYMNITGGPCDMVYVMSYLNQPQVQAALNANNPGITRPWQPCAAMHYKWKDGPSSVIPIYKRLMGHELRILLYSGVLDSTVPATGTRYALASWGLKIIKPWKKWVMPGTSEEAGFEVVYKGLRYRTVRNAGHEVSQLQPHKLYYLLNKFLNNSW
ncbi:peptidase S10, serine carboxypeptidase, Alpha/Beta hydrolase fold protein [Artemisia annua]|uniref:Peptidase S10, serine carboxypeptidase, Alpha/Beta hydrolase fold protein n=1 Tax=Artemisia annua TaxID=35608 RepID=A0A2U1MK58_ARTAN|nr:peptidase S10, serine carboxypeptidase, Alpha/Beta hydrolase fold protein [Artemisia annua]